MLRGSRQHESLSYPNCQRSCLDSQATLISAVVMHRSRERSKTARTAIQGFPGATALELGTVEALADLKYITQDISGASTEPAAHPWPTATVS